MKKSVVVKLGMATSWKIPHPLDFLGIDADQLYLPSPHLIYIFLQCFFFHFLNDSIEKSTVFDRMDEGFLSFATHSHAIAGFSKIGR